MPEDTSNIYYDRVYLCYEEIKLNVCYGEKKFGTPTTYGPITGFNCYKYSSFQNADDGWYKDRPEFNKLDIRHTMIPMCKWVPEIFDKYILNWKLKNMYWKGKIWTGKGYNRK